MDIFLDTCVIFDNFNRRSGLYNKSNNFIQKEKNFIISDFQKTTEIPGLFRRLKLRSKIILSKALSPRKDIPDLKKINSRDKQEIKEILSKFALGLISLKDLRDMKNSVYFLEKKMNMFIKNDIKRIVIPKNNIDLLLAIDIEDLNKNFQDSQVIASAIQEHQNIDLTPITSDKKDWKQEYITKVCQDNSYRKIPVVKFIQDM